MKKVLILVMLLCLGFATSVKADVFYEIWDGPIPPRVGDDGPVGSGF